MQKKLTAQGPRDRKSYTVTLPIEWVKKERLDRQRSVELDIVGNKIIISSRKEEEQRVVINAEEYKDNLVKVLQGLYRIGVREIKLIVENEKSLEETTSILEKYLIGYEVVEQKKDYVIIKDITRESEEDFGTVFRRIFLLLLQLAESDNEIAVKTTHKNAKRLINYCQRILMRKGHADFTKTPIYYLILDRLEKIGDELRWVFESGLRKNQKNFEELMKIFRTAYELFYKFDPEKYTKYQYRTFELKNQIKLQANIDKTTIHLHNLARILNSLYADIFTLRFDAQG